MAFELLDSLCLPGDPEQPNEDAYGVEPFAAAVFDGATPVNEPLMPGRSDAAWIAQFGVRRLLAHLKESDSPRAALRHAMADTERSFAGLRRREPQERYEIPCASMMLAVPREGGFDALWYGDCAALVLRPGRDVEPVGHAFDKRASEKADAVRVLEERNVAPVAALGSEEFLPFFRDARAHVNTGNGSWLFAPDVAASEHVARARINAPAGTLVLLCTDGFLALSGDYDAYDAMGLIEAADVKGLEKMGQELRSLEASDPEGRRFPRFKKSDDATALLLRLV